MAKTAGVHLTAERFSAVVLEGSAKRWRIAGGDAHEITAPAPAATAAAPAGEEAAANTSNGANTNSAAPAANANTGAAAAAPTHAAPAIAAALKKLGAPHDPVTLTIGSAGSVFRNMQLPFTGDEAIRKVLKFECESQLHQFNIDDVIIVYSTVEEHKNATDMVIAVSPKKWLRSQIDILEKAGYDPLLVDLDAFALFNALVATNSVPADKSVLVLHVGREETLGLVIVGGRLRIVRSMRLGFAPKTSPAGNSKEAESKQNAKEIPAKVEESAGGEIYVTVEDEAGGAPVAVAATVVETQFSDEEMQVFVSRLAREAMRTLAAGAAAPEEILLCGEGTALPDLAARVGEALELPAREIDVFANIDGAPADPELRRKLPFALGGALKNFGIDATKTDFRQEDLRFSKKLEKLKIPLASLAAAGAFTLLLQNIYLYREVEAKKLHLANDAIAMDRNITEVPSGSQATLKKMKEIVKRYEAQPPLRRLQDYSNKFDEEIRTLRDLYGTGGVSFIKPQSSFEATQRFFEFLKKNEDEFGTFVLDKYSATTDTNNPQKSKVAINVSLTFIGEGGDCLARWKQFLMRLREQKWVESAPESKSKPVETGVTFEGFQILVDLSRETPAS